MDVVNENITQKPMLLYFLIQKKNRNTIESDKEVYINHTVPHMITENPQ